MDGDVLTMFHGSEGATVPPFKTWHFRTRNLRATPLPLRPIHFIDAEPAHREDK